MADGTCQLSSCELKKISQLKEKKKKKKLLMRVFFWIGTVKINGICRQLMDRSSGKVPARNLLLLYSPYSVQRTLGNPWTPRFSSQNIAGKTVRPFCRLTAEDSSPSDYDFKTICSHCMLNVCSIQWLQTMTGCLLININFLIK